MTSEKLDEKAIFNIARRIESPGARAEYLQQACGADVNLIERVETLLRGYEEQAGFLESPAADFAPTTDMSPIAERPGTVIGPYKLLEQIGEGGMGVVFMAEQTEPIQRTVALKIIKPGMDTRQVIARFEAERQALAMMDHPNIARVLDVGATDTGRPYFVMDLVKGVPITDYCDQQHLPVRRRLELMSAVCQAVQHAHQKGIIHRDLKPSNVLVAEYDGRPVPKIIDFGVAKATAQRLTERTMFTEYGQLIGTFEYMSPEQARFNQLDVDTRSDIYSLGVLLYELLAGSTPLEKERLRSAAFDEILRIISEEDPPRPSTRLSSSQALPSISAQRQIEPAKLKKLVRGELDWIVMKCLEKDRGRRYDTANSLVMDIQRHLNDEQVLACPPSTVYRFRKFARRNKAALIAGSVIAGALILGLVGTSWQAIRATRAERMTEAQRDRALEAEKVANTEAAIATAVNDFLNEDLLSQADPAQEPDREIKLRRVLDRAAEKVETRFSNLPLVEAAIRTTLGRTYLTLDETIEAERHLKRAHELYRRELGEEHPKTLESACGLAWAYRSTSLDEAQKLFEQTLALQRKVLGEEHPETLVSVIDLAITLDSQERPAEGIALMERLLPVSLVRRTWGDKHRSTLRWMNTQANMLRKVGRGDEAIELYQQALDIARPVLGEQHPTTLTLESNLAISLRHAGRIDEALKHDIRVADVRRRVLGEEHGDTSWSIRLVQDDVRGLGSAPHGVLGVATYVRGGPNDPEAPARVVELIKGIVQEAPQSGGAWTALGMAQYQAGDWRSAVEAWEKSMEFRQGSSSIDGFLLSMAHRQLGNVDHARRLYDQAVQWMDEHRPADSSLSRFRADAAELLGISQPQRSVDKQPVGDQTPNTKNTTQDSALNPEP